MGSVKTVIGHTEGAAGLAGLLKVVQSLQEQQILPNMHFDTLNPNIAPFYNDGRLEIPTQIHSWPKPPSGQPARANVNSFGFGGTNAFAIVERYEPEIHNALASQFHPGLSVAVAPKSIMTGRLDTEDDFTVPLPLLFSAASPKSLLDSLKLYRDYFQANDDDKDIVSKTAWHLYKNRAAHQYRLSVVVEGDNTNEYPRLAREKLDAFIAEAETNSSSNTSYAIRAQRNLSPKILAIFTGQGAQYAAMSKGLYHASSVYRASIKALDTILQSSCLDPPSWRIEEQLLLPEAESQLRQAAIAQPLCTALQIALVDLLTTCLNVSLHCVVGHSSGEIAAAYAAGRLSRRDAILVAYYRGRFAYLAGGGHDGTRAGGMLACALSREQAEAFVTAHNTTTRGTLCVAASNSPTLTTLSGDLDAVISAVEALQAQNTFARRLNVDTAYHSPHMLQSVEAYSDALAACNIEPLCTAAPSPESPTGHHVQWVSSVHGSKQTISNKDLSLKYWGDNMISPVLFEDALRVAVNDNDGSIDCAIEIGPHPALKGPALETIQSSATMMPYFGLLDRKLDAGVAFAQFLGNMWTHFGPGCVNLARYIQDSPQLLAKCLEPLPDAMPSYPWDHSQVHWRESRLSEQHHFRREPLHELLGVRTRDDNRHQLRWRNMLKLEKLPWAQGHKFQGQALLPASAYCVMAVDAAKVLVEALGRPASVVELQDLEFLSGITLEQDSLGVETLFSLSIVPDARNHQHHQQPRTLKAEFSLTSVPVKSYDFSPMKMNFRGKMCITFLDGDDPSPPPLPHRHEGPRAETLPVNVDAFYTMMDGIGLQYTGPFQALQTMDRRLNYAEATLVDSLSTITDSSSISPAVLDSCFQVAFATFSSPGDKALWTSFLPTNIGSIRFNLSAYMNAKIVECHLTKFEPYTMQSAASMTADLFIFDSHGDALIQVEDLVVSSFASTKPRNDYELYLHTVLDVDPEEETATTATPVGYHPLTPHLIECCERVAQYYGRYHVPHQTGLPDTPPLSPTLWSAPLLLCQDDSRTAGPVHSPESDDAMDHFVKTSRYAPTLQAIRETCQTSPEALPKIFPVLFQEGQQLLNVQERLARVVRRVSHRYPRMKVLDLTHTSLSFTEHIQDGLRGTQATLGVGMAALSLDEIERQDLVIFSLSSSWMCDIETSQILTQLQNLVKIGGFLIVIHLPDMQRSKQPEIVTADENVGHSSSAFGLDLAGFTVKSEYKTHGDDSPFGLSLRIRQHEDKRDSWRDVAQATQHLLLIGGQTSPVRGARSVLDELLAPYCHVISRTDKLEQVTAELAADCTTVILLADLEEPICPSMTDERLAVLNSLIRPNMVMLWVTCHARFDPDRAASFGLTRSLLAETPNLTIQVLDLDDEVPESSTCLIADAFRRLCHEAATASHEPEIHVENGKRLIPRVVPYQPANDRLNAYRRTVSHVVNTLQTCVRLEPLSSADGNAGPQYQATDMKDTSSSCSSRSSVATTHDAMLLLRVEYSAAHPVTVGTLGPMYVCIGRVVDNHGDLTVGLSHQLASIVEVQTRFAWPLLPPHSGSDLAYLATLITRMIWTYDTMLRTNKKNLVLVEPDAMLLRCAQRLVSEHFDKTIKLTVLLTTVAEKKNTGELADGSTKFLSPWSTVREVRKSLPPGADCAVYDFLPEGNRLSGILSSLRLEADVEYFHVLGGNGGASSSGQVLQRTTTAAIPGFDCNVWITAVRAAMTDILQSPPPSIDDGTDAVHLTTPAELLGAALPPATLATVINWKADRNISIAVQPILLSCSLRPDRTYILVGLTRDLGQSLCRLFATHGARHIIIASRNPPSMSPAWVSELHAQEGVHVRVERLDVTCLEDVERLQQRIVTSTIAMPPVVGGLVNGAMVLNDRVFAQMDASTWHRVLRPKTLGSSNLHTVFRSSSLDFFIMTSSFAATGGHAGQSNYAAANMYMNGLAAQRRQQGLAGSVLNIGVIYGLGLLARETRADTYGALERDGYPPISERDLHHMFMEAIAAGRRPVQNGEAHDLTTGLARFRIDEPNPLHWHRDRRFCHFTVSEEMAASGLPGDKQPKESLRSLVWAAETVQALQEILEGALCGRMEVMLQMGESSITAQTTISELGIDSLVAVEIRSWFYTSVGADVPVMAILGAMTISSCEFSLVYNFVVFVLG